MLFAPAFTYVKGGTDVTSAAVAIQFTGFGGTVKIYRR
jgi:hypothetical protein